MTPPSPRSSIAQRPSVASAPPRPSLPPSAVSLLRTPTDHETGHPSPGLWSMPRNLPLKSELVTWLGSLQIHLQPASEDMIRMRLMDLALVTSHRSSEGMTEQQLLVVMGRRASEYARLLADLPADILADACDRCAKVSTWFPSVADLRAQGEPLLAERREQIRRVERMLEAIDQPQRPAFVPEPREQRLGAIAASYLKTFGPDDARTIRAQREAGHAV